MKFSWIRKLLNKRDWPKGCPQVSVEDIRFSRERGAEFVMKHPMFAALASEIGSFFAEQGGMNYVEFQVCNDDIGPIVITVRKADGETPAQQVDKLKRRVKELESSTPSPA